MVVIERVDCVFFQLLARGDNFIVGNCHQAE